MIGISNIFGRLARSKTVRAIDSGQIQAPEHPAHLGAMLLMNELPGWPLGAINICAAFALWWQAPHVKRCIYRVRPATATRLRLVGLGFIPERPPASWPAGAFIVESVNPAEPLVGGCFSISAYQTTDQHGVPRYFFIGLKYPDGIVTFGVKADLGGLNARMASEGRLFDLPEMIDISEPSTSVDRQREALALIRFVISASYYVLNPGNREHVTVKDVDQGPPSQAGSSKGRRAPLWRYRELSIMAGADERHGDGQQGRGALDKSRLALEPCIVAPHIRMIGERVVIVDAYSSRRWRKPMLGTKLSI